MSELYDVLADHVGPGRATGAVGLVARGGRTEVQAVGFTDAAGTTPMTRDSIFRIASLTKPVVAAAVMLLVEEGRFALEDPVAEWLPELANPVVVRRPSGPADDVVPASRPITVFDLLTFRAGYGFPSDFEVPAVELLFSELDMAPLQPQVAAPPDEWMAKLSRVPLLHQPGEGWLYHVCSDIQGVLVARASGTPLQDFLAERLFEPLGMVDTGFAVPAGELHRFTSFYRQGVDGTELADPPEGEWSRLPAFPSGGGGLVSTVDDWHSFARMLLAEGVAEGEAGGRRVLSPESVRQMTTDHLTGAQRSLFLEGQGWGFGGSVDVERTDPWNVPGRYGWVGGTGTAGHIVPSTGDVTILFTQFQMTGPTTPEPMRDFWRYAAGA
ncbi:serine hydrolase domain-containing protein [Streptomyces ovatisporus]|uniref:Serine hydrolase domain-containing protein n=1 Tax=Streptomyces ovatisporus TaxID=1128682 RepID=A0ABV9A0D4_9ACTN